MKVLIDTNVLVSSLIGPTGASAEVLRLLDSGAFELVCSSALYDEYARVLNQDRLRRFIRDPDNRIPQALETVRDAAIWVELNEPVPVSLRDPGDVHVLAAALTGEADYLVTGDNDLLTLPPTTGLRIVSPSDFIAETHAR